MSLSSTPRSNKPKNDFLEWLQESEEVEIEDEYQRYCRLPTVPGIKQGLKWWLEPTQQQRFQNLSKMAIDILSILTMSTDPE